MYVRVYLLPRVDLEEFEKHAADLEWDKTHFSFVTDNLIDRSGVVPLFFHDEDTHLQFVLSWSDANKLSTLKFSQAHLPK